MVTTSASTGTYNWHSLKEYAEQPLTNLAKTIYQATSMLQFEGNIEILNTNADLYFGKNISINSKTKNIVDKMPAYFVEENLFTKTIKPQPLKLLSILAHKSVHFKSLMPRFLQELVTLLQVGSQMNFLQML